MKYCKKCVMPDTRPGIVFQDGVCQPCLNYAKKATIDWDARWKELETLCDKYRGCNGDGYDCAIAVSGGKDSHFQVNVMKNMLGMNPVLLTVDNFTWTETGRKNIANLSEVFGCNIITFSLNGRVTKIMFRKALAEMGSPTWLCEAAIYAYPYRMAMNLGLKLLVYGENISYEYGGAQLEETYSAKEQIENDVVKPIDFSKWLGDGLTMKDLDCVKFPSYDEIEANELEPVYLSYFVPWDSHRNYLVAKRFGFQHLGHEWQREGTIEQYNQIDTIGYNINQWFKYPKFGHASATEMASRWIRAGRITREEGIALVKKYDKHLDQNILNDFLAYIGMSHTEFWDVADKFYNPELFYKDRFGFWKEKFTVGEDMIDER